MTPCTALCLVFFSLVFWGPDGILPIALTRDLKEKMKSLLVICTEHETRSNSKAKPKLGYFLLKCIFC